MKNSSRLFRFANQAVGVVAFIFSTFMLAIFGMTARSMATRINGSGQFPWELFAEGASPFLLLMCGSVIVFVLTARKQQLDSRRGFPINPSDQGRAGLETGAGEVKASQTPD